MIHIKGLLCSLAFCTAGMLFFSCEQYYRAPTISYTVRFETYGGSKIKNATVIQGEKMVLPPDPTHQEYSFGGWYSDEDLSRLFDFQSPITKDLTLYAKWIDGSIFEFDKDKKMIIGLQDAYRSLTSLTIPATIDHVPVEAIERTAFKGHRKLQRVTVENGILRIGEAAFAECASLILVSLPESIADISAGAFEGCTSLPEITIPNNVTLIDSGTFQHCYALTSITIPPKVTTIKKSAFEDCYQLTSVILPGGLTHIEKRAFGWCDALRSIVLPDGVTYIGESAFEKCELLPSITIPNSVASIEEKAFHNCISLAITFQASPPSHVGKEAFAQVPKLRVPKEALATYKKTNAFSEYISAIEGY